jgi:hypothetical protein
MLYAPCSFAADIAPRDRWYIDYDNPSLHRLEIRRGSTLILEPTVRQNGTAVDLTDATNVFLAYKAINATNFYAVTGSVYSATGGVIQIRWTSAQETTNSALVGDIYITSTNATAVRCPLAITLTADAMYQATATNPTPRTSIDGATTTVLNPGLFPWFYLVGSPIVGQSITWNGTNWIPSSAGAGDMVTAMYDPAGGASQVAFATNTASLAQGIAGTNAQARVAVLETNTASLAQGIAATNAQARVAVLETNTASLAQGIAGTNAQARVAVLETNTASLAQGIAATNAQARVAVLETNTASLAQGIAATNAQARVAVLETNTASLAQGIAGTNAQARVAVLETNTASLVQGIAATNAQARVAILETNVAAQGVTLGTLQGSNDTAAAWQGSVSGRLDNAGALTNWPAYVVTNGGTYSSITATDLNVANTNAGSQINFGSSASLSYTNRHGYEGLRFHPTTIASGHDLFMYSTAEGLFLSSIGINGEMFLHGSNYISMSVGDIESGSGVWPLVGLDRANSMLILYTATNSDATISFGANGFPVGQVYPRLNLWDYQGAIISNAVIKTDTLLASGTNIGTTVAAQGVVQGTLQTSNDYLYANAITKGGSASLVNLNVSGVISQTTASASNYFAGRVGIGTASPKERLHVSGKNESILLSGTFEASVTNKIKVNNGQTIGGANEYGTSLQSIFNASGIYRGAIVNISAGAEIEAITILNSGNVGVGTNNPATKLDINGNCTIRSNLYFNYAGMATAPTPATNQCSLWVSNAVSAVLYVQNGAGVSTKLSAHDENMNPVYEDIMPYTGISRQIDLLKLSKAVEAIAAKFSKDGDTSFNEYTNIVKVTPIPKRDWRSEQKLQWDNQSTDPVAVTLSPLPTYMREAQRAFDAKNPAWAVDSETTYTPAKRVEPIEEPIDKPQ